MLYRNVWYYLCVVYRDNKIFRFTLALCRNLYILAEN